MSLSEQISRAMSLREPQSEALAILDRMSAGIDYKSLNISDASGLASKFSKAANPVEFDTDFPSLCYALATGVGKTRLMGASIYYLWKSKGYKNFFILAPNITIYDKLRAELNPAHEKYMFTGLSDFPKPQVYDGDNYIYFTPRAQALYGQANVFIFNISKIFNSRKDIDFKFHEFRETLGNSFSAMLRGMDDLVIIMDESHRYRGDASLKAINHLKPVLGLEFTATPTYKKNVVYSFGLAESIGRYVKIPTVVTRTNLTTADAAELEKIKILDGLARHELKKARLTEHCAAERKPLVKPFVLISTKNIEHAGEVARLICEDSFCEGRYKDKVIQIHSGQTGSESDENIQKLLTVEQASSAVEVVVHVNKLKEGWDVKNLYTLIPLRASTSEILTEQTIGRGLRLPFGQPTGDEDLDTLEIISHDQYSELIREAKDSKLFRFKELKDSDFRPLVTEPVQHGFESLDEALDHIARTGAVASTSELQDKKKLETVVKALVEEETKRHAATQAAITAGQDNIPGLVPGVAPGAVKFDPAVYGAELHSKLSEYVGLAIDVPDIVADVVGEAKLEKFAVKVNRGPFKLVDQNIRIGKLATGEERDAGKVEVIEIENPRAFLAAKVIDSVDELDATNDKALVLALVDDYLKQVKVPAEELGKIVHLYRDAIIGDIAEQIHSHFQDETKVNIYVRSGFVKFRPYSKSILAKEGTVHYTTDVPKGDIGKYLFEGYKKTLYPKVAFDSTPEKVFSVVLEKDKRVIKWLRPPKGGLPVHYKGGEYNPDFIVETGDKKYIVEIKAENELRDAEVKDKALAGTKWCQKASEIERSKKWEYKLVPDTAVSGEKDFEFIIGNAAKTD